MRDLADSISATVRERLLFRPGEKILVALSGGLDSMVLLHLLQGMSKENGWRLAVAHLNHQLRGRSSNADEALVQRTAEKLRLEVVMGRANVRELSRKDGLSLEMSARRLRHEFLAKTAIRLGASSVALAHHADDQVEQFLLRLLRGSGGQGLAGMKWKSPSPVTPEVHLVRPLLEISKQTLKAYARQNKIRYREDATNACLEILRNRVRHELLPLLKRRYQSNISEVILRAAEILGAESEFVRDEAKNWLDAAGREPAAAKRSQRPKLQKKPGSTFADLHVAVQRSCLQEQLIALGITPDYQLVEKLRICGGTPVCVSCAAGKFLGGDRHLPGAVAPEKREEGARFSVLRDKNGLLHLQNISLDRPARRDSGSISRNLTRAGSLTFEGLKIRWKLGQGSGLLPVKGLPHKELFDADKVGPSVVLRHWRPGDRFQPIGMHVPVKVQDLFTNHRIPREIRHSLAFATTADGEIFWIEGLRISERFKLTSHTIRSLHWGWQRL